MTALPEPRSDGLCCDCAKKPAVTNDGRWCRGCLKRRINQANPMVGCYKGTRRTTDHRQGHDEDSPWLQNAIRSLEDLE